MSVRCAGRIAACIVAVVSARAQQTPQPSSTPPQPAAHWAFVPPQRPALPPVQRQDWVRNPIDHFVLARLERAGLRPSPEAARALLLRRLSFDSTGLPPSLEELDAFAAASDANAYEQAVQRLLASPQAAEHQARYWLDAARYGDTHGMEADWERTLWPWRDQVIRAFAQNQRFDQFTLEQLAGDLLPNATDAQRLATGFHRNHRSTAEGGLIEEELLSNYAAERAEVTGTVWLGLTVGCARCHDHKYDPITQRDYYALFDFFHSIDEQGSNGNAAAPMPNLPVLDAATEDKLAGLQAAIAELEQGLAQFAPASAAMAMRWQQNESERLQAQWQVPALRQGRAASGASIRQLADGSIRIDGAIADQDAYDLELTLPRGTFGALRLEALRDGDRGPGRDSHGNFVLTDLTLHLVAADGSERKVPLANATADFTQRGFAPALALDDDQGTGWAIGAEVTDHALVCSTTSPVGNTAGTHSVRVHLAFRSPYPRHALQRFRLALANQCQPPQVAATPWQATAPIESYRLEHLDAVAEPEPTAAQPFSPAPQYGDDTVHALPAVVGTTLLERLLIADRDCDVVLALGSDDGIGVWLDGDRVHAQKAQRAAQPDQEIVPLHLAAGSHRLRLAIVNTGGIGGFYARLAGISPDGVRPQIAAILQVPFAARSPAHETLLRDHWRRQHEPGYLTRTRAIAELHRQQDQVRAQAPKSMVMRERTDRRPSHVLQRGRYDLPGAPVSADTPQFLPPLGEGPRDRLALARWLCRPDHPLMARVTVNRLWQQVFGRGIVDTPYDFGTKGSRPSHPELLDWLACEFVDSGFDVRHMLTLFVTSATYRQTSTCTEAQRALDPDNRLLGRGSRYRLDAECVRDQALSLSGLLVDRPFGPSVRPYQPPGIWEAVAFPGSNTQNYVQDHGEALWRRSIYTFWKRTAPPVLLHLLDAPSRETCAVWRERTDTPLQALGLLNDTGMAECARTFAARLLRRQGSEDARIADAFRSCTARVPDAAELATLKSLLQQARKRFGAAPAEADKLVHVGEAPPALDLDGAEHAAWTTVCAALLNLDATLSRS